MGMRSLKLNGFEVLTDSESQYRHPAPNGVAPDSEFLETQEMPTRFLFSHNLPILIFQSAGIIRQ
jgi:hypothetical protein